MLYNKETTNRLIQSHVLSHIVSDYINLQRPIRVTIKVSHFTTLSVTLGANYFTFGLDRNRPFYWK